MLGIGVRHLECLLISLTYCTFYMEFLTPELCLLILAFGEDKISNLQDELLHGQRSNILSIGIEHTLMVITTLIAGIWSVHKGLKYIILLIGLSGTFTMYTIHLFTRAYGWQTIVIAKILSSICRGLIEPLLYAFMHNWIPNQEKGRLAELIFLGKFTGGLLVYTVGYYLAKPLDEWSQLLYWSGNISVLWAIAWCAFAAYHPKQSFILDKTERKYIQAGQPHNAKFDEELKIPWSKILMTMEFYPLIFTHMCIEWSYETVMEHIDSYLMNVHNADLESVATLLGYGSLAAIIVGIPIGILADLFVIRKVAVTKVRKVCTCTGMWGAATAIAFLAHTTSNPAIKLLTGFYMISSTPIFCGFYLSFLDYSPNYGSVLYAISSCCAFAVTSLVPIVRSALIEDDDDVTGWKRFFYTALFANYLGGLIYALYVNNEIKSFNKITRT